MKQIENRPLPYGADGYVAYLVAERNRKLRREAGRAKLKDMRDILGDGLGGRARSYSVERFGGSLAIGNFGRLVEWFKRH